MGGSMEAFKAYLESYRAYVKSEPPTRIHSFVTISRQAGAGGISIAAKLASILNKMAGSSFPCTWTTFDKDLITMVIEKYNLSEEIAPFLEETTRPHLQDIFEEMLGMHPSRVGLVRKTSETIVQLGQMGYATIVGRGANILTRHLEGGLHVRVVGSLNTRIEHLAEYLSVDLKQAERIIQKDDEGRRKYLEQYFSQKIDDPLAYDLIINTDKIPYVEAARVIADRVLDRYELKVMVDKSRSTL